MTSRVVIDLGEMPFGKQGVDLMHLRRQLEVMLFSNLNLHPFLELTYRDKRIHYYQLGVNRYIFFAETAKPIQFISQFWPKFRWHWSK